MYPTYCRLDIAVFCMISQDDVFFDKKPDPNLECTKEQTYELT